MEDPLRYDERNLDKREILSREVREIRREEGRGNIGKKKKRGLKVLCMYEGFSACKVGTPSPSHHHDHVLYMAKRPEEEEGRIKREQG